MKMKSSKELIKVGLLFAVIILAVILTGHFALGERLYNFLIGAADTDSVQLLLISNITYNPGTNNIGDIVGIFDADHQFSQAERDGFTIIRINGTSREQIESELAKLLPDTSGLTEEEMRTKITQPKYRFNISDISNIKTNVKLK